MMNLDSILICKCGKEKDLFQFLITLGYNRVVLTIDLNYYRESIYALLPKLKCTNCNEKGFITIVNPAVKTQNTSHKARARVPFSKRLVATDKGVNSIFHKQTCGYAKMIKREDEVFFDTREEAMKRNYDPCKTCKP